VQPEYDYKPTSYGSGSGYEDGGYKKNPSYGNGGGYGDDYYYNPHPPKAPHIDPHNVTEHLDYHPDYYFDVSPVHCCLVVCLFVCVDAPPVCRLSTNEHS
jgi:hypothetical protein